MYSRTYNKVFKKKKGGRGKYKRGEKCGEDAKGKGREEERKWQGYLYANFLIAFDSR